VGLDGIKFEEAVAVRALDGAEVAPAEHRTVTGAFLAHLRWLRVLGTTDDAAAVRDS